MSFKIGVLSDSFRSDFRTGVEKAAALGVDGVQVYAVSGEMDPDTITDAQVREKIGILKGCGVAVSALCGDLGGHGFTRREDNARKIEKSKRIIDLALRFGTNIVTTHIGVVPHDTKSDTYAVMQEACVALAQYASSQDAYFALETGLEKAVPLRVFLDGLGTKALAVNLDPANLVMLADDDPVAAVYELKDYIVHTHAKDGICKIKADPEELFSRPSVNFEDYFEEKPLGEGGVDFDGYLKALGEIGYNGYLTIEREVGDDPERDIKAAVSFLRGKIG